MQAYIWALVCTKNMTGIAKIVSEKTGKDIIPLDISNAIDKNYDGLVSFDEIKNNVNELFGDEYDVNVDYWTKEGKLDKDKFVEISNTPDTYVLGRAYGDHLMVGLGVDYQISVEKR